MTKEEKKDLNSPDESKLAKTGEKLLEKEKQKTQLATQTDKNEKEKNKKKSSDIEHKSDQASADKKQVATQKEDHLKKESVTEDKKIAKKEPVRLKGLFVFKMSMTRFYNDKGRSLPVTALKYEPSFVSQIKTEEKDSYSAVQTAFKAQKNKRCSKAQIQHLKGAGFKEGAGFIKEMKQAVPENVQVGDEISIHSIEKGDLVRVSSVSKGKGFTGVMKRWNFRGGRASHGSKAHRRTGSIGQHTKQGRDFPGRKMPGHHRFQKVSLLKVPVVDVFPEEGIIFVKGPVPGARNTLVRIQKT